jgi:Tol biopolymer transport system component
MRSRLVVAVAASALLVLGVAPAVIAAPTTDRVSLSSANAQGNGHSGSSATSKSGKIVAFDSGASNLVANDLNGFQDIFVRNRKAGKTTRVSVRTNGSEANNSSFTPLISDSGRFVAFGSVATNLVGLDGNGAGDVFVHDRTTKKTTRVSTRSNGAESNGFSNPGGISDTGRFVVFSSDATNLVPGDSNGATDVFVKDRQTGKTKRVSKRSNGAQGNGNSFVPTISPNGRYVSFTSAATNLVVNDSNGFADVFVHDRTNKTTRRVSVASNGAQANNDSQLSDVSNNGVVVLASLATNLVNNDANGFWDAFAHRISNGQTRRVSISSAGIEGNGHSGIFSIPRISADGDRIAFDSQATNLVAGDTNANLDVFLRDRSAQTTRRVSVRFDGTEGNTAAIVGDIAATGRFVSFLSNSTNLVGGDTNAFNDVFIRGPIN